MYDGLRVLVLGACNLTRRLEPNTTDVHSLQDTLQLVRLCTGELDMPSWNANYID